MNVHETKIFVKGQLRIKIVDIFSKLWAKQRWLSLFVESDEIHVVI